MTSYEIRKHFLDFFKSKGHHLVPAAPIVVKGDPSLMFTNAGMNQFKEIFLGNQAVKYPRIADTQHCLRVSGKHNDLEDVGHDTYHHTLFEMLGNWSFGDYFKKEAIDWAWELLTEVYQLDKSRIYATVFGGDATDKLAADEEARAYWQQYLSNDRILNGSKKDNFWEMGDAGPCGPCSELHIDLRSDAERAAVPGHQLVNADHPQVVEIWNLVFMQFNRLQNGQLVNLPAQHVDTGMGFERLCMALQQKKSTYDTDVFQPLINQLEIQCGHAYGADEKTDIAFRVISDHIRAITFIIADGQLPSNNKAGYVCRRILRRALRYGYTFLGLEEPFLYKLIPTLSTQLGEIFPQLPAQLDFIQRIVKEEELSFLRTLTNGLRRFDQLKDELADKKQNVVPGKEMFELFDTYGFPVDLIGLLAKEQGLEVDEAGFQQEMAKQKERSREAAKVDTSDWTIIDSEQEGSEFVGYDQLQISTRIQRFRQLQKQGKSLYQLVLNETPFYAESGGQVGDTGYLLAGNDKISVLNSYRENNLPLIETDKLPQSPDQLLEAVVDQKRRKAIASNHSATHLLHAALREVLGKHVEQKGSLVNGDYLRFDFSHFAKLTDEELEKVELLANQKISAAIALDEKRHLPLEEAKKMGAMALFGEKYGEFVRVISFDPNYSVELCGGTHVNNTAEIGLIKITAESSIATGVRRIEALSGEKAWQYVQAQLKLLQQVKESLRNPKDLIQSVNKILEDTNALRKQVEQLEIQQAALLTDQLQTEFVSHGEIRLLAKTLPVSSADLLKRLAVQFRQQPKSMLVLGAEIDGKAQLVIALSDDLVNDKKLHAAQMIRELAKEIQGGGGGQPFLATAGGQLPAALPQVYQKVIQYLK